MTSNGEQTDQAGFEPVEHPLGPATRQDIHNILKPALSGAAYALSGNEGRFATLWLALNALTENQFRQYVDRVIDYIDGMRMRQGE